MTILNRIKADESLEVVATVDTDRVLIKVPIDRLESHPTFQALRDSDPKDEDFTVMVQSLKVRGMFYPPLVFADTNDDGLRLYIVDGNQRVRAARKANETHVVVCVVTRWTTIDEAFRDGVSAQFAKFAVGENDVFSIAATGNLTNAQLVTLTGYSESKIRRISDIAEQPELAKIVKKKLVGTTQIHKLLKQCNNHPVKIAALTNTLVAKADRAIREAKKWKDRIQSERSKKWDKAAKDKADAKFYFRSEDWEQWIYSLGDENNDANLAKDDDDNVVLDLAVKSPASKFAVRLGDSDEWKDVFAIFNLAGKKHDEVDLESLGNFVEQLPLFCDRLQAVYDRRCEEIDRQKARKSHPTPTTNPVVTDDDPPAEPAVQGTDDLKVE